MNLQIIIFIAVISINKSWQHSTQRPSSDDDSNPFLDMATTFLQETIANQNGGNGLGGIASLIGNMMQPDGAGKSEGGGIGAAQIISGIGSLMANSGGAGGGGFDPSIISNVLEMFTGSDSNTDANGRQKRSNEAQNGGVGLDTIINIASAFINSNKEQGRGNNEAQDGLMSLLPMVVQAYNSFTGPEGDEVHAKHKEHAWVLPPFLEKIHVIWDHFSNSELAEALWKKSGVHSIFKVKIPCITAFVTAQRNDFFKLSIKLTLLSSSTKQKIVLKGLFITLLTVSIFIFECIIGLQPHISRNILFYV